MTNRFLAFARRKSVIGAVGVTVAVAAFLGWRARQAEAEVRYVLGEATRGTLLVSVDGSGQVEATQQLEMKAKGSGDVAFVGVKKGDTVAAGTLLVQIDTADAARAVRDAQSALESALLSLEKLKKGPTAMALLQAEHAVVEAKETLADLQAPADAADLQQARNAVAAAEEALAKAERDVLVAREEGYNAVIDGYRDLSDALQGLRDALTGHDLESGRENSVVLQNLVYTNDRERIAQLVRTAEAELVDAYASFDAHADAVAAATRTQDTAAIEALVDGAVAAAADLSAAVRAWDAVVHGVDEALVRVSLPVPAGIAALEADLATLSAQADGAMSALLSRQSALRTAETAISAGERTLAERQTALGDVADGADATQRAAAERRLAAAEQALADLTDGPDALDLRSQELTVRMRRDALADAQETLGEYAVIAPFEGIVADVAVQPGDAVNAGTVVVTLITESRLARVSLNEVDTASVEQDQKVTLTFDALPDLSIAGTVAEVDILGDVSQGVVSYGTVIAFETQDERIRPGMSVAASIVTDLRTDALLVPSGAVRKMGDVSAVQTLPDAPADASALAAIGVTSASAPELRPVTVGLDNGQMVEVLEGLAEGDRIVVRTVDPAAQASAGGSGSRSGSALPGVGGQTFFSAGGGQRTMIQAR